VGQRPGLTIAGLFGEQVRRTPEGIAVIDGERQISYGELEERSAAVGRYLSGKGVGPGEVVPVCIERSVEMVVGILGILKAVGGYMPVDPAYPRERVRYMVEDCGGRVVLSSRESRGVLEGLAGVRVVEVEEAMDAAAGEGKVQDGAMEVSSSGCAAGEDRLGYVIYTSGSTGRPKGVEMGEKALINLLLWHEEQQEDSGSKRVLQFASLSFDASFQEIFSVLCFGGSVVLIGEQERRDMAEVVRVIRRWEVTQLFIPYVVLKGLSEYAGESGEYPESVREIFTAGEQLKLSGEIGELCRRTGLRL
jgi:non-ribosomal peptide synthetase component F